MMMHGPRQKGISFGDWIRTAWLVAVLLGCVFAILGKPAGAQTLGPPGVPGYIGSGGGAGFVLGPEQNQFTGTTLTIAQTARDTYATANPTWLAEYDGNTNIYIQLTHGANVVYQRRFGGVWQTVQGLIIGPSGQNGARGAPGGGAIEEIGSYAHTASDHGANVFVGTGLTLPAVADAPWMGYQLGGSAPGVGMVWWELAPVSALTVAAAGDTSASSTRQTLPESNGASISGNVYAGITATRELLLATSIANQDFAITLHRYVPSAVQGGGGLTTVASDATLTGDGSTGDPLAVASPFTTTEKTKLGGVAAGAEVNVQADWDQTTATADDYIENKPTTITTAQTTKLTGIETGADVTDRANVYTQSQVIFIAGTGITLTPDATGRTITVSLTGTTPPPASDHTRYAAVKATNNFTASDFTGGSTSTSTVIAVPGFTTAMYVAFATPSAQADLTDMREQGSQFNSRDAFTPAVGATSVTLSISGTNHDTYISTTAFDAVPAATNWVIQ